MAAKGERYIWIARWEEFQHYAPERDRPPVWIKDYTKQLDDDRIRNLSLHQRGLLASLRQAFSKTGASLEQDRSKLSARLGATVYQRDLDALNHAGLIEIISRTTLERRLEQFYNGSRPRARVRRSRSRSKNPPTPQDGGITSGEPKPKFVCDRCVGGLEFKTAGRLADHLRNVHDIEAEAEA